MDDAWVLPVRRKHEVLSTLVDRADAVRIGYRRLSIASHGYAQISVPEGRVTLLHRWILGLTVRDGFIGDHINGNPLDNRRSNLRIVHASGSSQNVSGRGKSPFRGVYPTGTRWEAKVKFKGVLHYLGTFQTEEQAAAVADAKRRELMPFYVPPEQRSVSAVASANATPT
jgi:hypothetical protein